MEKCDTIRKLQERHDGEEIRYTTCYQNGCWDAVCILKCHVKEGKLTAIETDDSINKGLPREDVGDEAIASGMLQARPCVMGHSWKRALDDPDRILYPMRRIGKKGEGNKFERISWDEALDTIAAKIQEVIDIFGPHSILHLDSFWDRCFFPFAPYINAGVGAWGENSAPAMATAETRHFNYNVGDMFSGKEYIGEVGFEAPDLFNSKIIIMWGMDPLVSWFGYVAYYIKLAHEKGIPVILIDPRYTTSAEVLADQWIPIRPGTDTTMMLAMAQVIFEEDLLDHSYLEKNAEPESVEQFRRYVMGIDDGIVRGPEWAETICGVPAGTIRELAELYATSSPAHLQLQYSVTKRHGGEYTASLAMLLQVMTGNLTVAGGCETGICIWTPERMPVPEPDFGQIPGEYQAPICLNHNKMSDAILMHKMVENGTMSEADYRAHIGCPPESPTPNIQMLIGLNNFANGIPDTNKCIRALHETYFSWGWLWNKNQQTIEGYDIVLPAPVFMFESTDEYLLGQNRFMQGPGGMHNYFMYAQKIVDAPGEVRAIDWVWSELARRLGIEDQFCPRTKGTPWDEWDNRIDEIYHEAYDKWYAENKELMSCLGADIKPWDEFLKMPIVRIPIEEPFHAFKEFEEIGENPFKHTPSGKFEFVSSLLKQKNGPDTQFGGYMDPMPRWELDYMPDGLPLDTPYDKKAHDYPLVLTTAVSMFRQQSCNDKNPLLNDCYKHAVWMSPVDAASRGIGKNSMVRVFNHKGEMRLPVYITNRMSPGTVMVYHGRWYRGGNEKTDLMPFGIDYDGSTNIMTDDVHLPHAVGVNFKHALVQIEKLDQERG